jgi:hypothetical protein
MLLRFIVNEMRCECFPSPVSRHDLEFHLCTRSKLVRIPVENRCVQEYVLAAVIRSDKSVTAHMIELQYPARNHARSHARNHARNQLRPPPLRTRCL